MEEPKKMVNQQDLINMYRTPPPTTAECTLLSSSCKTCIKIDHKNILGHKIIFDTFLKIETIQGVYFDYNGVRLEIDNVNIRRKSPNTSKLNNILLNKPKIQEKISSKIF